LFADLLADDPPLRPRAAVGGIITAAFAASATPVIKATTPTASVSSTSSAIAAQGATASALRPASLPSAMTGAGHKEVTVTTTKDFAGQLVHVTRTVAVGSEEHKKMMQVNPKRFHSRGAAALPSLHPTPHPLPSLRSPKARGWSLSSGCWAKRKRCAVPPRPRARLISLLHPGFNYGEERQRLDRVRAEGGAFSRNLNAAATSCLFDVSFRGSRINWKKTERTGNCGVA
jgi:hypothetical protein